MAEKVYSRKLDAAGRLLIPVKLREELGMEIGKTYDYTVKEIDKHRYICIDCGEILSELDKAKQIVQSAGLKIVENVD